MELTGRVLPTMFTALGLVFSLDERGRKEGKRPCRGRCVPVVITQPGVGVEDTGPPWLPQVPLCGALDFSVKLC